MAELTEVEFEVGSQRVSLVHFLCLRKSGVIFTQNEYVKLNYRSCSGVKHMQTVQLLRGYFCLISIKVNPLILEDLRRRD